MMGKYLDLFEDVFSVFGTPAWTAQSVKTLPGNFIGVTNGSEFIRVNVIPSGSGLNLNSTKGILNIDIFVKFGVGPKAIANIADKLDQFLVGKSISISTGTTQFEKSSLSLIGKDPDSDLYRAIYTISFNHFGV